MLEQFRENVTWAVVFAYEEGQRVQLLERHPGDAHAWSLVSATVVDLLTEEAVDAADKLEAAAAGESGDTFQQGAERHPGGMGMVMAAGTAWTNGGADGEEERESAIQLPSSTPPTGNRKSHGGLKTADAQKERALGKKEANGETVAEGTSLKRNAGDYIISIDNRPESSAVTFDLHEGNHRPSMAVGFNVGTRLTVYSSELDEEGMEEGWCDMRVVSRCNDNFHGNVHLVRCEGAPDSSAVAVGLNRLNHSVRWMNQDDYEEARTAYLERIVNDCMVEDEITGAQLDIRRQLINVGFAPHTRRSTKNLSVHPSYVAYHHHPLSLLFNTTSSPHDLTTHHPLSTRYIGSLSKTTKRSSPGKVCWEPVFGRCGLWSRGS